MDVVGVPPLKVHCHDVGVLEDKSVKFTVVPAQIDVGDPVKFVTGAGGQTFTVMYKFFVIELLPQALVAVRETLYVPDVLYVITGYCDDETAGVPPGNDHDHDVGVLVERSKKLTCCASQSEVGEPQKSATGGGQLLTVI